MAYYYKLGVVVILTELELLRSSSSPIRRTPDTSDDKYERDYDMLRDEARELKNCQLQFIQYSIAATGLLLTVGNVVNDLRWMVYLIPLVIILPCWLIFNQKVKSYNRILGYLRVLELLMHTNKKYDAKMYVGWENAVANSRGRSYRYLDNFINGVEIPMGDTFLGKCKYYLITPFERIKRSWNDKDFRGLKRRVYLFAPISFETYQEYVYWIFLALSIISIGSAHYVSTNPVISTNPVAGNDTNLGSLITLIISIPILNIPFTLSFTPLVLVAILVTIFTAFINLLIYWYVNNGIYSADKHMIMWMDILGVEPREFNYAKETGWTKKVDNNNKNAPDKQTESNETTK